MPGESRIEWTDATWNPVTGCSKVSQGCKHCYAEALFARLYPGRKFTDVRIHPERLDWPLRWRGSPPAKADMRPSRIFVNSMSDLFHENVSVDFIKLILKVCALSPQNVYQILTKRPRRMLSIVNQMRNCDFWGDSWHRRMVSAGGAAKHIASMYLSDRPRNIWLGVSVEDQQTADERIPLLLQTPAAVRWVSYEPALGPVDFDAYLPRAANHWSGLEWVVAGGESGPQARPNSPDWFRSVRDQCLEGAVPFFFKQWGGVKKRLSGRLLDGMEWDEFPSTTGYLSPGNVVATGQRGAP